MTVAELSYMAEETRENWENLLQTPGGEILKHLDPQFSALGIKAPSLSRLLRGHLPIYFEQGDQVHGGPVNDRSIFTICKPEPFALRTMRHVKLLQRRPGSNDPLGLDHVDLVIPGGKDLGALVRRLRSNGVPCEVESNDAHAWISIRHNGFEFKLVDHEVWDVCIAEMEDAKDLRDAHQWEEELGITIMDPDGWRRDEKSLSERISRVEFMRRMRSSTLGPSRA